MTDKFDLHEGFRLKQEKLLADLRLGQGIASHPTTLGDASELDWVGMLGHLLPHRYGVAKAHVIDSRANQSLQIDVVIHDQFYSPLLFEKGGAKFIPAESVYAVFEVKQNLNKDNLEQTCDKVASVRELHRTSGLIPNQFNIEAHRDLATFQPVGGILSERSEWSPPLGEAFRTHIKTNAGARSLDLGCALTGGSFEIGWRGVEATIDTSEPDSALIYFAMRLLRRLQAMGTVPAIVYSAYERSI
jgi:hypothetical protein